MENARIRRTMEAIERLRLRARDSELDVIQQARAMTAATRLAIDTAYEVHTKEDGDQDAGGE